MASLPPLPDGATLLDDGSNADLLKPLLDMGVTATNGYRTPADVERLRAAGYTPAVHTKHLAGDAVDLIPGRSGLSWADLEQHARSIAAGWEGGRVINEGDHIHLQLPGWGQAPGTPGTKNFGLPPLPSGATLVQRGSLLGGGYQPQRSDAPVQPDQPGEAPTDAPPAAGSLSERVRQPLVSFPADPVAAPDAGGAYYRLEAAAPASAGLSDADRRRGRAVDPTRPLPSDQSYRTDVPPAALAKLQAAFDGGASPEELQKLANGPGGLGLQPLNLGQVREMVNYRDAGNRGARFMGTDVHQALDGPRPGETTRDYYARITGGQTIRQGGGDPTNPTLAEGLRAANELVGNSPEIADQNVETARSLPFIGDAMSVQEGLRKVGRGNVGSGAKDVMLGAIAFVPGEKALAAGSHVVDGMVLRNLAKGGGEEAERVLRSVADDALSQGGAATLHLPNGESVRLGPGLVDGDGRQWTAQAIDTGAKLELHVPPALHGAAPRDPIGTDLPAEARGEADFLGGRRAPPAASETVTPHVASYTDAQPASGNLWRLHPEELQRLHADRLATDDEKLVQALGPEGAARFKQLDRMRNSSIPARSDEGSRLFDAEFANLTPQQERLIYGIGETDASADDIKHILRAHEDVMPGDGSDWSSYMAAVAARGAHPEEFAAVLRGEGSVEAQAQFVRMRGAYAEMRRAGVPTAQIPGRMVDALVQRAGWRPEQAQEIVGSFVRGMEGLGTPMRNAKAAPLGLPVAHEVAADLPPLPPGAQLLTGPEAARARDYIDVRSSGVAPGWPFGDSSLGQTRHMGQRYSDEELAAIADRAQPRDFQPYASTPVRSEAEAVHGNPGTQEPIHAPDEFAELSKRQVVAPSGQVVGVHGPLDTSQVLRLMGGVRDEGGDLSAMGIGNLRSLDFGSDRRLGPLVSKNGLPLDDAARALWEKGYFPGHVERPTVQDLLDRLHAENALGHRFFHPDDLHEVDRFNAARAQRYDVEAAAQEGRPLVAERGHPMSLDELRASEPPEHALNDLADAKDRVGNINLQHASGRFDPQRGLEASERLTGFNADRPAMTFPDMLREARNTQMEADDLLARRIGQGVDPGQALRARQILLKSTDEMVQLGAELERASPEEKKQFAEHVLRHLRLYEQVSDMTATAARTLGSFRIPVSSKAINQTIHRLTANRPGEVNLDEVAKLLRGLHDTGGGDEEINRLLIESVRPSTTMDRLLQVYYASMLSGPHTHAANMLGNTLAAVTSIPEYGVAALFGKLRGKSADRFLGAEVGAYIEGLTHGTARGWEAFRAALKTGRPIDGVSKIDIHRGFGGKVGKVLSLPTKALVAEDEFFKGIARNANLYRLAARRATLEGLKGDEFTARMKALVADPPGDMLRESKDFARYMTFQRDLGWLGTRFQELTDRYPILKFKFPFIRTQTNIVKFAAERSPAALLMPTVRQELKAGGARRDLALAKIAVGSGIGAIAYELAAKGLITGGESPDWRTRKLTQAEGWQPYSFWAGDRWVSYRRLDPLSLTLGTAADLARWDGHMTSAQKERSAAVVTQVIATNIAKSNFLGDLGDVIDLVQNPKREAPRQGAQILATLAVPNIVAQPNSTLDPVKRSVTQKDPEASWALNATRLIVNSIKARVPWLRQTLPARTDDSGQPAHNDSFWGRDLPGPLGVAGALVSPLQQQKPTPDAVRGELLRTGLRIDPPKPVADGVPLTAKQHAEYSKLHGEYVRDDLSKAIRSPEWQGATPDERKRLLTTMKRNAAEDAKADLGLGNYASQPAAALPPLPPGATLVQAPR